MADYLEVQILSLDEKMKVKRTELQMLTKSQVEAMASSREARSKVRATSEEERVHRRALKVALEILEERACMDHSNTFHKEETTTLSQKIPRKTSRALLPKQDGKHTRYIPKNSEKKIELSKFLVVSLIRCDSLCADKIQKHTAIGSVRSEMEPKSSLRSRVSHSFLSLSKGSGKECEEKAGTSAVMSLCRKVMKEGACAKPKEGIPIRPSVIVHNGLEDLKEEAQAICPKTLTTSHENSHLSENIEDHREAASEPSLACEASCSNSSNLHLTKRKRKFHVQWAESAPQKGQPVDDSKATTPVKYKEIEFSKFLLVSLVRCDSLCGDKLQKHTAIGSVHSEMEPKSSPRSRVSHSFPSLSEDDDKEGKEKAGTSTAMSLHTMVIKQGACTKHQEGVPIWPSGILHRGLEAMKEEAWDIYPKTLARFCESSPFSGNIEDPREAASEPSLSYEASCSSSSNRPLAKRKRKLQIQQAESGPKKGLPVHDSKATGPIKSKNRVSQRQGQPTRIAYPQEPRPIERGMVVWFKFQDYPYWPSVVVSIQRANKTARVLLIEAFMSQERRGIQTSLQRLKPLDCQQKPKLMERARKLYGQSVDWCCSLLAHYREGTRSGAFAGSFLEYFEADISYSIRKAVQEGEVEGKFPKVNYNELEKPEEEDTYPSAKRPCSRLLPDRMKAARNRETCKLLDFIVKRKGAERHLLDILGGRKQSAWLNSFLSKTKYMVIIETYLEDEDQLDVLVKYLQEIYKQIDNRMLTLIRNNKVDFLLEVLLPEAIICSISAVEGLDYKDAEAKYLDGPPVHYREKELFDKRVIAERRRSLAKRKAN